MSQLITSLIFRVLPLERVHAQRKDSMRRGVVLRSCVRNGGAEEGGQCAQQGDWQSQEGGSSWVSSLALACNLKSLTIKNLSVCKCTGNLLRISYMRVAPEIVVGPGSQAKKDATTLQEKSKSMKAEIVRAEERAKEAEAVRDRAVTAIGNLVHDSVPVSNDEVGAYTLVL